MNLFCKLFGHTWVHQSENVKISWNNTKKQNELVMKTEGKPKFWLECHRCGIRNDSPSREEIRAINN